MAASATRGPHMSKERLVIIGGVAAGMSAASRARKLDPRLEIVVLEKGRHVSYGICGLPHYLSGQIADARELVVYTPEFFREKRAIDVRLEHAATEIDPGRKIVRALCKGSQPVDFPYDKLVIATGGAPALDIPGAKLANVFTCNDLDTAIRFRAFLDEQNPKTAAIVGSGYIGLEVSDALAQRGIQATVLERSGTVLEGLEPEIAERVEGVLSAHGVRLVQHAAVNAIVEGAGGRATTVQFGAGGSVAADLVVLATGIVPRAEMARAAGIETGPSGAIAVDERMLTSLNSIYAAGDCAEALHLVSGRPAYVPLGTTANKQGRVAGENAAGGHARFEGVVGTLATQMFGLEVARTGLSTEQARACGFQADSVTITSVSRAKYLGGKPLKVTLIWDRSSGRLLGCQMCGEEGVSKRIDVAAMALHARLRIPEMLHLDLSYAPPFAPVWDPILIAVREAHKQFSRS
jgi:NADPH-dependent 2,4-dienoyl-CoA reductase/sulfur reductase-like enzyme